jgi:hypothetical protein
MNFAAGSEGCRIKDAQSIGLGLHGDEPKGRKPEGNRV